MADEPNAEPVVAAPPEPQEPEPVVTESAPTPEPPHPLQPGGARFEEVYARMKQAEERVARFEGMLSAQQRPVTPNQPTLVDPQQLQALVDQGRITPMQAADFLAKQNAQQIATQTTLAAIQAQQLNAKLQSASQEVNQYIDRIPSLRDNLSAEFKRVSDEAYRISDEMGQPVTDLRVQRLALRAVYGPLERLAQAGQHREQSRSASVPHVESGVGRSPAPATRGDDPLKDVDPTYLQFWQARGYTREQMLEEAKYIPKGRRVRPGATV